MRNFRTVEVAADNLIDFKFLNTSPSKSKKSNMTKKALLCDFMGIRIAAKTKPNKGIYKKRRI